MKAIVTGASSGIGRDIARGLSARGYDLVLVARRENLLIDLKESLKTNAEIYVGDLSDMAECEKLCKKYGNEDIDIFVNNAGFGLCGNFLETDLDTELNMIDLNIKALHYLTKFFINKFDKEQKGFVLNVASSAAFMTGPFMATYYSTKAYVLRLSRAIDEELRHKNSKTYISVLCPGPVKTEFDKVANVSFSLSGLESEYVAEYAVKKALSGKRVIVPGITMKLARFASKLVPDSVGAKVTLRAQQKKIK